MPENTDDPQSRRERDVPPDPLPLPQSSDESLSEDPDSKEVDFSSLLRNFDDASDLDDQVASDLDPGIDMGGAPEEPEDVDPALIDVGDVVDVPTELRNAAADGDEFGPGDDAGNSDAIEPPTDSAQSDDGDGVTGDEIETAELESLDAGDQDGDAVVETPLDEIGVVLHDDPPGPAALPWLDVPVEPSPPQSFVAAVQVGVLVGGSDVLLLDEAGPPKRLASDVGSAVASLLATAEGTIFYTTRRGELFRIDSRGNERVTAWTDVFDLEKLARALELGGMTPSSRPAMLLRVGNERGELLESTDHGSTFRRVDLGGDVLAVSGGSPPICLVKGDRAIRVLRSEPTGGFAVMCPAFRCDSETPLVAAHGEVVGVIDPERGVQVSADGGRSWKGVQGFASTTAIAAGLVAGRPIVFAALFNAAAETAKIACVDAVSAEAVVVAGLEGADNEDGNFARVISLAWNEHTETLWGAGTFGLRCWRRPPSA